MLPSLLPIFKPKATESSIILMFNAAYATEHVHIKKAPLLLSKKLHCIKTRKTANDLACFGGEFFFKLPYFSVIYGLKCY